MVYSNINNTVFYKEDNIIHEEDIGYESTLFELEIYKKKLPIVFGKIKYTFIQRNIVYVPIYLVVYNDIKSQIGVIEFTKNNVLEMLDDDNDIIIDKINIPLLFGFLNESFIDRNSTGMSKTLQQHNIEDESDREDDDDSLTTSSSESDDDEEFSVKVKPSEKTEQIKEVDEKLQKGIFTLDNKIKLLSDLTEETEDIAKKEKKSFEGGPSDNWLQTYFKSSYYNIHDVERNGDCFFGVVRDAFKQVGKITTVSKLRALLAKEVTDDVFNEHRELYIDLAGTINEYNRKLSEIKEKLEKDLNIRAKKARNNKYELRSILNEITDLKGKHKDLLKNKQLTQSIIDEDVGEFKLIDTIEKFREFIQTSGFWANSWAISTLENKLNVKFKY